MRSAGGRVVSLSGWWPVVDSVLVLADSNARASRVAGRTPRTSAAFATAPERGQAVPHRVDITKRGAMEAEAKRLADLAALRRSVTAADRWRSMPAMAGRHRRQGAASNRGVYEKK